eukprot:Em0006g1018a
MGSIVQLLLLATLSVALANDFPFSAILESDPATQKPVYAVDWGFNRMDATITFRLILNSTGWFGFGLSPTGGMKDSDLVVGWVTTDGKVMLYDCFADGEHIPTVDAKQDWKTVTAYEDNGCTTFIITRKWKTCDENDIEIMVTVPHDTSTTYWCSSTLLPDEIRRKEVYITKFTPLLTRHAIKYAHHAELYLCKITNRATQLGFNNKCYLNPGACSSRTLIAAWAVGGSDYTYPAGIGYPIGGNTDEFLWLEVHYDNPELHSGIIDSTGFEFFYTETPPAHEAGILAVGHMITPLMVIPPNAKSFSIFALCGASCMSNFIPDGGIHVISNGFHTHLAGIGLELSHLRPNLNCDGGYEELAPISRNMRYDFSYQQPNFLPKEITVMPSDILILKCIYNTQDRTNITVGGDSTHDEMCFSFLTYYPRMNLTTCASLTYLEPLSINKELSREDVQMLSNDSLFEGDNARNGVMDIFQKINWNEQQISDFQSANLEGFPRVFCESMSYDITVTQELHLPKAGCPYKMTDDSCNTTYHVSSVSLLEATNLFFVLLVMHMLPFD